MGPISCVTNNYAMRWIHINSGGSQIPQSCNRQASKFTVSKTGCARFAEFVQNFSEHQILWTLCSVDFHTFTLQLPIQTLLSVAPELHVFVSSLENFSKTSTPQRRLPTHDKDVNDIDNTDDHRQRMRAFHIFTIGWTCLLRCTLLVFFGYIFW